MGAIEVGKKAVVLRGRRAGKKVVITKLLNDTFVMAKSGHIKERKFNIKHLEIIP